ncbi:DoxX family membrane protein [Halomonas sp. SpR1]|uniref:DoxX family protein n=1 Tax=Halomonas sp. SpR1 TaxID=3050462 RepID=UPI0027E3C82D|nr:DoxX family membrane protein [Halomonas sp. SpR1]MDQ7732187.1 DoxX family membrane protein [Halomonas sp. SpR1]
MKALTLLFLRISLSGLMLFWGANKLLNTEGSVAISEKYYLSFMSAEGLLTFFGVVQIVIGVLILVGFLRRWVLPLQLVINGASLVAVFPSIIDPLGWYLEDTNLLFYPSLIIFASSMLLIAFQKEDSFSIDASIVKKPRTWKARKMCSRDPHPN